jgi:uroporphyrinogen-III decarboxylase
MYHRFSPPAAGITRHIQDMVMDKKWSELTPAQKREHRFREWLKSPGGFDSPAAEKAYNVRLKRLADTLLMKKTDRVPVTLPVDNFPALYSGLTLHKVMYDYDALYQAWKKFLNDFELDMAVGPGMVYPAKVFDIVDYKLYAWPGHGLPLTANGHQFVEGEYMKAEDYDAFIADPSDYCLRTWLPRAIGATAAFAKLPSLTSMLGKPQGFVFALEQPDVQAAFRTLASAGEEMARYQQVIMKFGKEAQAAGYPSIRGGVAMAPFDSLGDALRGTKGVIMDMYRRPDKVLKAVEVITDFAIKNTIEQMNAMGGVMVTFPLHKGDDTFMSAAQFDKFYWPSLKRFILALIDEGIMVSLFAEGKYNTRLETVKDLPPGWILWHFDQTDMALAKKVLGNTQCITGNVPSSLVCTGTPEAVKEYCLNLIRLCAKDGGYILTGGASCAEAKAENLRAMMEAAKEYGVNKK